MALSGCLVFPEWVRVRRLRVGEGHAGHRLVHFTDVHHRGDVVYMRRVIETINRLEPDFVCFTGDLVEDADQLEEALQEIRRIAAPVYGVPGNHDYLCGAPFSLHEAAFAATGGRWLVYEQVRVGRDGAVALSATNFAEPGPPPDRSAVFNLHLGHYPATVDRILGDPYDLLLAGHSHGGQIRIPLVGAPVLPAGVGRYVLGRFDTPAGVLYVNPGIGTWKYPVRFNCRPEITVFEI